MLCIIGMKIEMECIEHSLVRNIYIYTLCLLLSTWNLQYELTQTINSNLTQDGRSCSAKNQKSFHILLQSDSETEVHSDDNIRDKKDIKVILGIFSSERSSIFNVEDLNNINCHFYHVGVQLLRKQTFYKFHTSNIIPFTETLYFVETDYYIFQITN